MHLKIIKKEEKPLVEREEVIFTITGIAETPSKNQVQEEAAKILGKEKENIVVKKIGQKYGEQENYALVHVYASQEALKKFEPKKKEKKEETQQKAEAKKEEKKE